MSRRKAAPKREIMPDPFFKSEMVTRFVNCVMRNGKKSRAEKIVYGALVKVIERDGAEEKVPAGTPTVPAGTPAGSFQILLIERYQKLALDSLRKALDNVRPRVEVKSRRVGGSTYQVPVEVKPDRGEALAMRALVKGAASRGEKTMADRLAGEIKDALQNKGAAVRKREDIHKTAEANKAFAHYRW